VSGPQTLTVSGPGGTVATVPIVVAEPDVPTEPVATSSFGAASRVLSFGGRNVDYTVRVIAADGSEPVGEVTIYDGRKVVTTVQLEAGDSGRVQLRLPKLSFGIHLITAKFDGDGFVESRTWPSLVLVL
jgi:5'-nucleotidase